MAVEVERAELDKLNINLKSSDTGVDQRKREIWAYASTWEVDVQNDQILPGAFDATLKERKLSEIPVFWAHDVKAVPLGRPLAMEPDSRGLLTVTKVFRTERGSELLHYCAEMLDAGSAPGLSIGFMTKSADYRRMNSKTVRCIGQVDLREYSFCPPMTQANRGSVVLSVKSAALFAPPQAIDDYKQELAEIDAWLIEARRKEIEARWHEREQEKEWRRELDEIENYLFVHAGRPDPAPARKARLEAEVKARVERELAADHADSLARFQREEAKQRRVEEWKAFRLWWARNLHAEPPPTPPDLED